MIWIRVRRAPEPKIRERLPGEIGREPGKSFRQNSGKEIFKYDQERREVLPVELWFEYINREHYLHQEYLT